MRNFFCVVLLSGLLACGQAWADASEDCAIKAQKAALKGAVALIRAATQICKSTDEGTIAAFDAPPAGNGNDNIETAELAQADFDFAEVVEKVNKGGEKAAEILADGGAECAAHFENPVITPITEDEVIGTLASNLDSICY